MNRKALIRWTSILALILAALLLVTPNIKLDRPYATSLYSHSGELLSAQTSSEGQWYFEPGGDLPDKYIQSLILFEDRRFYWHPGVDPAAFTRALWQNIQAGKVVSGGSTLTMQLARISRGSVPRSVWNKVVEAAMAIKYELLNNKEEVLGAYAANAPFGGNVIGLEAATWRYFGKSPKALSWAEAATLAVLPNAPGLIYPGKNRTELRSKRDRLLRKLAASGILDDVELNLSLEEPVPESPFMLPSRAPHLLNTLRTRGNQGRIRTTIDAAIQLRLSDKLGQYYKTLAPRGIHNAAILVIDHQEQKVLAYLGNVPGLSSAHAPYVDLIHAPRSTGSILKPFLVMEALQAGLYTPSSWERDIPCWINGYHPENYHESYDGLVSIEHSLIRSLNVPMVFMLQKVGVDQFLFHLRSMGLAHLNRSSEHYGLSLITGGAEATLWEITQAYAAIARKSASQDPEHYAQICIDSAEDPFPNRDLDLEWLEPGTAWSVLRIMERLERPGISNQWKRFTGAPQLSWKTGTSFGFRDAWAVGVNARYTAGVWVGNADGEGRPGIIGVEAAAPLLLDIFRMLPPSGQTPPPLSGLDYLEVCRISGFLPGDCCERDTILAPVSCRTAPPCRYHQGIWVDTSTGLRAWQGCADQLTRQCVLRIPPVEASYWRSPIPYSGLPPWSPACRAIEEPVMAWVYPKNNARIFLPSIGRDEGQEVVIELAHIFPEKEVFWYLDGQYAGSTQYSHNLPVRTFGGDHRITVVDEEGNDLTLVFTILANPASDE